MNVWARGVRFSTYKVTNSVRLSLIYETNLISTYWLFEHLLPDVTEDFAAQALFTSFAIGHNATRGGNDRDPNPT